MFIIIIVVVVLRGEHVHRCSLESSFLIAIRWIGGSGHEDKEAELQRFMGNEICSFFTCISYINSSVSSCYMYLQKNKTYLSNLTKGFKRGFYRFKKYFTCVHVIVN